MDQMKEELSKRYADAYRSASRFVDRGASIRKFAIVTGVLIAPIGVGSSNGFVALAWLATSFVAGSALFLFGIAVVVQGQILRATIDSAVNTSPFLDDEGKASLLSLVHEEYVTADARHR